MVAQKLLALTLSHLIFKQFNLARSFSYSTHAHHLPEVCLCFKIQTEFVINEYVLGPVYNVKEMGMVPIF